MEKPPKYSHVPALQHQRVHARVSFVGSPGNERRPDRGSSTCAPLPSCVIGSSTRERKNHSIVYFGPRFYARNWFRIPRNRWFTPSEVPDVIGIDNALWQICPLKLRSEVGEAPSAKIAGETCQCIPTRTKGDQIPPERNLATNPV